VKFGTYNLDEYLKVTTNLKTNKYITNNNEGKLVTDAYLFLQGFF
jgi:hypothetical protein